MATTEMYIAGEIYGSNGSRSSRSSNIVAYRCDIDGKLGNFNSGLHEPRPGQVIKFLKHIIYVDKQPYEHHFALTKWYLKLDDDLRCSYGKLVQVYRHKHFENFGPASFIPVQRIKGKFVKVETIVRGQDVIVVLPRYRALDL